MGERRGVCPRYVADSEALRQNLMECLECVPTGLKREIIICLPEILDDSQHGPREPFVVTGCSEERHKNKREVFIHQPVIACRRFSAPGSVNESRDSALTFD